MQVKTDAESRPPISRIHNGKAKKRRRCDAHQLAAKACSKGNKKESARVNKMSGVTSQLFKLINEILSASELMVLVISKGVRSPAEFPRSPEMTNGLPRRNSSLLSGRGSPNNTFECSLESPRKIPVWLVVIRVPMSTA